MTVSDKEREEESAEAYKPDEIVMDQKGENTPGEKKEPGEGAADDATLQATWLRRVKTRPQDFLKAKFAWQAQAQAQSTPPP
jgi:Ca-activated chloride channel family protein